MTSDELRVIVNPTAARGAVGREWPEMRSLLLNEGLVFNDALTEAPGHATELAREALLAGYGTVVAVGGDGTVNEVVNGLIDGSEVGYGKVPPVNLAVISRGTGCDLMRTLGHRDPVAAVRLLRQSQATRTIDLGEIIIERDGKTTRRLFVNAAGFGFDGAVVEDMLGRAKVGKRPHGTLAYLAQVTRSVMHYRSKQARFTIEGKTRSLPITALFACNGKYFGGGMKVAPQADPTDGLFDIILIKATSPLGLLARVPSVYLGWHTHLKVVETSRAREVRVESDERLLLEADGELIGQAPATLRILPQALRLRV